MNNRNNLFGIIKYWSAYAVLIIHYGGFWRILRGYNLYVEMSHDRSLIFHPVVIFFAISGYLTAGSLERSRDLKEYFIKRAKRIYIPLWLSMAVYMVAYIIYARQHLDASFLVWIVTGLLGIAYTPSCLADFATGSANGVLWTVMILIQLFAVSGLAWKYIRKASWKIWIAIIPTLAALNLICGYVAGRAPDGIIDKLIGRTFIPYAIYFFIGFVIYLYHSRMVHILPFIGLAGLGAVFIIEKFSIPDYGYYAEVLWGICTAVAAVGIGSWSPDFIGLHRIAKIFGFINRFDFTYEVYLYHWLVINIFICTGVYATLEWWQVYDKLIPTVAILSIIMHLIVMAGFGISGYLKKKKNP